jgi:type II secretory pathway component GspD/PulD (secretin)
LDFFRLAASLPLSSQGVEMNSPRLTALVPVLMIMALPLGAVEAGKTPAATPPLSAEQEAFWKEFQSGALSKAQIDAEAKYVTARAAFQDGRFVEARELVDEAIRIFPSHAGAQQLREQILAVLTQRESRLSVATTLSQAQQNVKSQEIAVRLASLMDSGDKKMKAGDYAGAELDYDRVEVGLRSFPYQFDWGTLPTQVAAKKLESRNRARETKITKDAQQHEDAAERARQQADAQEAALKAKVDELLARAEDSYSRKDYKRAEVDAWSAYELDRRREDARSLLLASRRAGHNQFDDRYVPTRLETLSRVHEELHKSLIPQNELLVYPEDWQIRALRKPQEVGSAKVEPWVAQLNERLNQKISVNFEEVSIEDAILFLRQITGTTIILAPDVTAAPPVKLKIEGMSFREVLKWTLEGSSLKMALKNEAIYISSQPIVGAIALRMYDVTDLMSPVQDFPGKELAISGAGGGGGGAGGGAFNLFKMDAVKADSGGSTPEELIEFIKSNVAKETWVSDGMGIDMRGGSTLFVSQTPEAHSLIEQLLTSMRNTQSLQVNISVQILDVKKGFFEEIGVELTDKTGGDGQNPVISRSAGNYVDSVNGQGATALDPDGYVRLNNTIAYNGSYTQNLPENGSTASIGPRIQRGLNVDLAYHPFSFLGQDQINALFSAFEQETDAQILEHPTLTCFNGQRANTSFIHQRAYISDYDIVNASFDPHIDVLNFGNILDVRPVVSSDRKYITMEIRPTSVLPVDFQVEILNGFRTAGVPPIVIGLYFYPIELPNVEVRELRSTVMMPDKGTLMVGGFSKALRQRTHSGIPFLSHIPFLGRLFSKNGTYDENRRIFFLLNAEILDLGEKEKLR